MTDDARLSRRAALGLLGAATLAACTNSTRDAAPPPTTTPKSTPAPTTPPASPVACTLAPEAIEGPYYLDVDAVRSDITDGRPGTPLTLTLAVVDADSCTPISGARIDVWHADAGGTYSGVGGNTERFMRGTQPSGADGGATFHTIYPGWYPGRAVHVHVKVHTGGRVVHTGQLYFPDVLTDAVFAAAPYVDRGARDTRNVQDQIFTGSGGARTTLAPRRQGSGYAATSTLAVRTV